MQEDAPNIEPSHKGAFKSLVRGRRAFRRSVALIFIVVCCILLFIIVREFALVRRSGPLTGS